MNFSTNLSLFLICLVNMISFVESTPGKIFYIALPVSNVSCYYIIGPSLSIRIISYQITIYNVNVQPVNVNISSPFPGFNNISQDISGLAVVNVSIPNFADLTQNLWIQNLLKMWQQNFTSNVTKQSLIVEATADIDVLVAALTFIQNETADEYHLHDTGDHYSAQNILPVKYLGNTYSYFFWNAEFSTIFIVATSPMITNVSAYLRLGKDCDYGYAWQCMCTYYGYEAFNSVLKQGEVLFVGVPYIEDYTYLSINSDKPVAVFVQRIAEHPALSSTLVPAKFVSQHGLIVDISQFEITLRKIVLIAKYQETEVQVYYDNYFWDEQKNLRIGPDDDYLPVSYFQPEHNAVITSTKPIQIHYTFHYYLPFIMPSVDQFLSGNCSFLVPYIASDKYATIIAISPQRNSFFLNWNKIDMNKWEYIGKFSYTVYTQTVPVPSGLNYVSGSGNYMIIVSGCSNPLECFWSQYAFVPNMFLEGQKSCTGPSTHEIIHHLANSQINKTNVHEVLTTLNKILAVSKDFLNRRDINDSVTVLNKASFIPLVEEDLKPYFDSANSLLSVDGVVIKESQQRDNSSSRLLKAFDRVTRNFNGSEFLYNLTNIAISINTNDCSDESKIQIGIADFANQRGIIQLFNNNSQTMPAESLLTASAVVSQEDACNTNRVMFMVIRNVKLYTPQAGNSYLAKLNSSHDSSESNSSNRRIQENCWKKTVPSSGEVFRVFLDRNTSLDGKLRSPVKLTFKRKDPNSLHKKSIGGGFWELAVSRWSTDGCSVVSEDDQMIKFQCNHLTDFALLTDTIKNDPVLCNEGLAMFGYLSQGISTLTLALVFIASLMFSKCLNQGEFNPAMSGLLGFLLAFNIVFLIFANRSSLDLSESQCTIVAAILYTMMMSILCWALFVGFGLFKLYYLIFERKWIRNLTDPRLTFGIAIGFPILLTMLLWIFKNSFFQRGDNFCWINPSSVGVGIMLPVSLVLASDLCLTGLLTWSFFGQKCTESSLHIVVINENKSLFWKKIQLFLGMQFFLGAPWIAQYLTLWTPYLVPAHYVFTFLIATQGFWIACLYCMDHWKELKEIIVKWSAFRKLHKYSKFDDFTDSTSKPDDIQMSENVTEVSNDTGNPEDEVPNDMGNPKDEVPNDMGNPKDEVPNDTGNPKDEDPNDTGNSKDGVPSDMGNSKDEVPSDTGNPKDEVPNDTGNPKDEAPNDTGNSKDGVPSDIGNSKDEVPSDMGNPKDIPELKKF